VVDERYGGIPSTVRTSEDLLRLLLPPLRADLQMVETYQYRDEPPLDVEIMALGGIGDRAVSPTQLDDWRHHSTRAFSIQLLPGSHFFLFQGGGITANIHTTAKQTMKPAALPIIIRRIQQLSAGNTSSKR
jgi:medium-chain acyl-[acyl-carrier-protein] hydrolase